MSLLEDVFLEDEAGEARELERIIEGDEFDERPRSATPNSDENSAKEDEAEEDKRRVDPSQAKPKRVIKNPRFILNPARLTGPRGIQVITEHFKDFKFKGKGHEKEDLDLVLKKLEHWAYRLYPKFEFQDCLRKIETLGKKRPVMVHLHKIRTDQFTSEETVVQKDSSDEETAEPVLDEFDVLLQQQIDLARATPAPSSAKKGMDTPIVDKSFIMPKATSSPSINDEQRERMLRNRRLAEERRLARLQKNSLDNSNNNDNTNSNITNTNDNANATNNDDIISKKHNKSNIIDSSDDENENIVGQHITVDVQINNSNISQKIDDNVSDNDITEHDDHIISKKNSKSNFIYSSDEEEINVDKSVKMSHKNDKNTKNNDNDSEMIVDNTDHNDKINVNDTSIGQHNTNTEKESIKADDKRENTINYINSEKIVENESSKLNDSEENIKNDSDIIKFNVTVKDASITENVHTKVNENVAEEIMDVDFGDDF